MRELSHGICLLQPQDYRRMPWKNGLGMTTELAVSPIDAGLKGRPFDWRASLAEVEKDCEFSLFPGYNRSLMLVEGAGMELSFDSAPPQRIEQRYQPFNFKGEWQTYCCLLDRPVRDFNVISLRAKLTHTCEVVTSLSSINWQPHSEVLLIHCFAGGLILEDANDRQVELDTRHTLLLKKHAGSLKSVLLKISAISTDMVAVIVKISNLKLSQVVIGPNAGGGTRAMKPNTRQLHDLLHRHLARRRQLHPRLLPQPWHSRTVSVPGGTGLETVEVARSVAGSAAQSPVSTAA